jgi:predicted metal-binding membrane protein
MYVSLNVIKNGDDMQALFPFFATYLAVWSGAKVVEKLLDLLIAKFVK